jgi:hypothetical protein
MLTCYGNKSRLPQSDLAYVGFGLAALDTLCQMEISQGLDDEEDGPFGYLVEVPFLAQVAPVVQIDLLGNVSRNRFPGPTWQAREAYKRSQAGSWPS